MYIKGILISVFLNNYYARIYDPETALRLFKLIDIKPFLRPISAFDLQLMEQYNLV